MRLADFARLGLRNLARNRRRTALSLAIVGAGTAALVVTAGFVRFSFDGLREAMIHGGLGHLEVADSAEVASRGGATLDRRPTVALDDDAASHERWPDSVEHDALFAPDGASLARRLMTAGTLRFSFTPHNAAPVTAVFNVHGLAEQLKPVAKHCGGLE